MLGFEHGLLLLLLKLEKLVYREGLRPGLQIGIVNCRQHFWNAKYTMTGGRAERKVGV